MLIIWENEKLMLIRRLQLKLMQMLTLNFFKLLLLMLDMVLLLSDIVLLMADMVLLIPDKLLLMLDTQQLLAIISILLNAKLIQRGNARRFLYRPRVKWLCPTVCLSLCVYLCPAHTAPQ